MIDRCAPVLLRVAACAAALLASVATTSADVVFPAPAPVPSAAPAPVAASRARCAPPPSPCEVVIPSCACVDPCARRRGPVELRDQFPLAQPFLTLPALSPDTLGCGRSSLRAQLAWSNSFGWRQTETGEDPLARFFLVDAEARTLDVTAMHGVTDDLDVGVRLALHWRGAGFTDEAIDAFHELFSFLGVSGNKRGDFDTDRFRLEGVRSDFTPFDLGDEGGVGLGNVEGIVRRRVLDGGRDGWSAAVVGRVTLPTGTAPFDVAGVEVGAQVVAARPLRPDLDLFVGLGAVYHGDARFQGLENAPVVGHGFAAVEWRFSPRWSAIVQTDYATRQMSDVAEFDRDRWTLSFGAKVDLDERTTLEGGFVENLVSQQTTVDFGIHLGIEHRF